MNAHSAVKENCVGVCVLVCVLVCVCAFTRCLRAFVPNYGCLRACVGACRHPLRSVASVDDRLSY